MTARRGPYRGEIQAAISCQDSVPLSTVDDGHSITARLVLSDGTVLQDTRTCLVVEPPAPNRDKGKKKRPQANYNIIEVWRDPPEDRPGASTWNDLGWDQTDVGKYDLAQDAEENELLLLYVNMDNQDLIRERERRLRRLGETATRRLDIRYQAYVGHHLWLHNQQQSKPGSPSGVDPQGGNGVNGADLDLDSETQTVEEGASFKEEMQRVAKTVILAMRSEADLFAVVSQGEEADRQAVSQSI